MISLHFAIFAGIVSINKVENKEGIKLAFKDRVAALNLTEQEQKHLLQSKSESDGLVVVEVEVMDAVDAHANKHGYAEQYRKFKTEELNAQTLRLFDSVYDNYLQKIGGEIKQFNDLLFKRIELQITESAAKEDLMQTLFFSCLSILVVAIVPAFLALF